MGAKRRKKRGIKQKAVLSKIMERTAQNRVIFGAGTKKEKSRNPHGYWIFRWRSGWDSNPRAREDYLISENIVTHDATCIMAYESYAASHRALLQHYAKRPEVLEEKMSEWRHDFFHPIKGGDTTRHNLILKAALSLSPSLEVEPDTKKYFQVNPACPHSEDTARKTAAEYLYGSHKVPATKGYAALESLSKSKTGSTSSWALYYMAKMRLYGIGTTRNYEEALRLFAQSQQAGNEYAEQALRTARQEHIVYHAKSALAITRTLIRQLAQNMSQTTTQNHTMGLTRHQKLRRAMKHKKELHEPLYP